MRSSAAALLWETWRVTRLELLLRIAFALVLGGLAVGASLLYVDSADNLATILLLMLMLLGAMSGASLKEFPFSLGFVRPIPTWVLVAVPMLFVGFSSAMVYIIPVTVLKNITNVPLPMFSVATLVALTALILVASSWWSRSKAARTTTQYLVFGSGFLLYKVLHPEDQPGNDFPPSAWENMFDFSVADYGLFLFMAIAALSFTLVGVGHQRHGGGARLLRRDVSGNLELVSAPHWVNAVLRAMSLRSRIFVAVECPTGSPLRAQVWFEARTVGWAVLSSGLVVTLMIPAFFAAIGYFDLSPVLVLVVVFASPTVPLMAALSTVFPLQSMNDRWSLSGFDATLPMRSALLVGLKVAFALASIVVAAAAIYASIWMSFDLVVVVDENLARLKPALLDSYHAHSAARLMVYGSFVVLQLATVIACLLSVRMFSILYMSRVVSVIIGAFVYLLAFIFANAHGFISVAVIEGHVWAIVVVLTWTMLTVYYRAWKDWTLSAANIGWAGVLALASVVVHVAFVTGLGEQESHIGALEYLLFALALIPVTAIALAPWSVDLLRHR